MSDLKNYLSIGSCQSAQWQDAQHIVFVKSGPGGKSIVRADISTGRQETLAETQERIWKMLVAANGDIFYTSDEGGNENEQIYKVEPSGPRRITSDGETRHNLGGLLPDGRTLIIACNARDKKTFDIMALDVETGEKRMILQNTDNYNTPAALSPDGRYLLYNKLLGSSNNAMWMVDTASGKACRAPASEAVAAYESPAWKHTGDGFYYVTDEGADFFYIGYYDVKTASASPLLHFDWDVEAVSLSPCDRYLAILTNEAGYSVLRVYDLQDKVFCNIPQPPRGVYSNYDRISWADEGLRLAFTVSSGKRPQDVWALDMREDWIRRVSDSMPQGLTSEELFEPTLHEYQSFDGLAVPYFLYTPKGKEAKNLPVMVSIHGGPEGQSRPDLPYQEFLHYMVAQGIAVVEPNVRGSTGYGKAYSHLDDVEKRLDSVRDIEALVQHLVDSGVADRGRIGVMGTSYGGFMTLSCAARYPELWCCAVCTVGMFNLVTFLENTASYRRPHRESEYGTLAHDRETLLRVSPIAKVDQIRGPLMIIHGQNDPRVPVSETHQAMEYLSGRGVDAQMLIYPDEGHGLSKLKNKLDCYPKVVEFIKKHMGI